MGRKKGTLKNKTFTIQKTAKRSDKAHTNVIHDGQKLEANLPKPPASSEGCSSSASSCHEDIPYHPLLSYPCCLAPEKCHFGGGKGLNEHFAANIHHPIPYILKSISRDQGISDKNPQAHLLLSLSFPTVASVSHNIPTSTVSRPCLISFDDPNAM